MDRPFSLFGEGLAWYSMEGSFSEFRQMAQVSAQMSQLHLSGSRQAGGNEAESRAEAALAGLFFLRV